PCNWHLPRRGQSLAWALAAGWPFAGRRTASDGSTVAFLSRFLAVSDECRCGTHSLLIPSLFEGRFPFLRNFTISRFPAITYGVLPRGISPTKGAAAVARTPAIEKSADVSAYKVSTYAITPAG